MLSAALLAQAVRASRLPSLRLAIRRHLRRGWDDGVIIPLARSREAADRALLHALPRDVFRADPATVRTILATLAARIPAELALGSHVLGALRYMDDFEILVRASDALDRLSVAVDAKAVRRALGVGLSDVDHSTDLISAVIADARQTWSAQLAPVAGRLLRALDPGQLPPGAGAGMARACAAMRKPICSIPRRRSLTGRTRRERLILALTDDLVGSARAFAEALVRRHAGLEAVAATYDARGDLGGRAVVSLTRTGVSVSHATTFDVAAGRIDQEIVIRTLVGSRTATFEEAEAVLDAHLPAPLDTPAHRTLRRLRRNETFSGLPMARSGTGSVVIADLADRRIHPDAIAWLTAAADENQTTLQISPDDDPRLIAMIVDAGFSWEDGDGIHMTRRPGPGLGSSPKF